MRAARAALRPGRELPGWSGSVLDLAVPVQQMIALPFEWTRDTWRSYVAVVRVGEENAALRSELAVLEDENLQLREALVATGPPQRISAIRE